MQLAKRLKFVYTHAHLANCAYNILCNFLLGIFLVTFLDTTSTVTNAGLNPINQGGDNAASRTPPTYYRCGKPGYYTSSCKYKGHLQKVCRSKQSKPIRRPQKPVNNVQDDATDKYQLLNRKSHTLACIS